MADKVGVIGAGNMGSALVKGWLRAGRSGLLVWDTYRPAVDKLLAESLEIGTAADATDPPLVAAGSREDLVKTADTIVVVVKPKDAKDLLGSLRGVLRPEQTVVSAMAGLPLDWLRAESGPEPALFRIMPNLAVALGAGAVAVAAEEAVEAAVLEEVLALCGQLGLAEVMPEDLFDVFTAVSGSSPAFLALAIEGLEDGAVAVGLSRAEARRVVREAALETARTLSGPSDSPTELERSLVETGKVSAGTMSLLEERSLKLAFRVAVEAAMERSRQMRKA